MPAPPDADQTSIVPPRQGATSVSDPPAHADRANIDLSMCRWSFPVSVRGNFATEITRMRVPGGRMPAESEEVTESRLDDGYSPTAIPISSGPRSPGIDLTAASWTQPPLII